MNSSLRITVTEPMPSTAADRSVLYEQDYYRWIVEQIRLLKAGDLDRLDVSYLVEELEDVGRSERRAVKSNVAIVLLHLLKYEFQPERRSRSASLVEHRQRLRDLFEDSPSLRQLPEDKDWLQRCYEDACRRASAETGLSLESFPGKLPYSAEQVLDETFLPG